MDLGLIGKKAIVCASSQGLGLACAKSLAREGCEVFINGRDSEKLKNAVNLIQKEIGKNVHPVVANINTEQGRQLLINTCPEADILINNNAGSSPGKLEDWDRKSWDEAIEANMLAPIFLIQALIPGMRSRKFGRIVNITSAMVKSPSPTMGLSTACRAALTALSKSVQREAVVDNVTINNLLPERFNTDRQRFMVDRMVKLRGISREEAINEIVQTIAAGRMGDPLEFGDTCAFICSNQASFMSGQNIQLDGGSYRGLI
jgi:3-oxoacyl-[acyl-carrier protein] reductase